MNFKIQLIILGSILIFDANAGDILASKEAIFEDTHTCTLSNKKGVIKIKNKTKGEIIETSQIDFSHDDTKGPTTPAINATGNEFYQWFQTQVDYSVIGKNKILKKFYAKGFRNIINNSEESNQLISILDKYCDDLSKNLKILGEFQIDLKIGSRIFEDKLLIKNSNNILFGQKIEGTYIVPNSFESKVQFLNYNNGKFSFIIRVQENDEDYLTIFEGDLDSNNQLEGSAFILPSRKLLGTFTGRKIQ